jgi:hypothetical protein
LKRTVENIYFRGTMLSVAPRSILCHETGVYPTYYGIFAQGRNGGAGEIAVAMQ